MKDFIEPFLYPHNLFLWAFLFAAIRYRKIGLFVLLIWFYLFGNTFVANVVRDWYGTAISTSQIDRTFNGNYVLLGCGGSIDALPDCAKSRLEQLVAVSFGREDNFTVYVTTLFCQPYVDYLKSRIQSNARIDCFHGGATTYHEMYNLADRLDRAVPLVFVSSDYHAFRVKKLAEQYQLPALVYAAPSSTFRQVNCGSGCFLTVNLSNYDLFAKLTAEMVSFYTYDLTRDLSDWYKKPSGA